MDNSDSTGGKSKPYHGVLRYDMVYVWYQGLNFSFHGDHGSWATGAEEMSEGRGVTDPLPRAIREGSLKLSCLLKNLKLPSSAACFVLMDE